MKTSDAIEYFGGKKIELARALGLSPSAITQWGDSVPVRRQYELERLTKGDLKVAEPVAA
ncbi:MULTISPECIES: Cro/CI family transcriptional regulator [Chromohalobacter]|uniref:Cro/CI family transcriptional regulator n=1 Tax=Chromohalobacter TaxID=42054 RepID=UPI0015BBB569|nr:MULTISPECIES: Cro/CI family transcriptional regulator [Chromohalobacter]MDV6318772.1 Cro/CI family transcriptional regulator [Chromohalobacter sp. HP20-39]NWO10189.1 Cro/Cl family transcriptional regulator [Chromohalobacter salexigens]